MLFARQHRFNLDSKWFCHCRFDSSPQFNRDYFISEIDLIHPGGLTCWKDVGNEGVLITRMLVGQMLGARASGVIVKTRKLLNALALESWCLLTIVQNILFLYVLLFCDAVHLHPGM